MLEFYLIASRLQIKIHSTESCEKIELLNEIGVSNTIVQDLVIYELCLNFVPVIECRSRQSERRPRTKQLSL